LGIGERIIWAGQRVGVEYLPIFDVFLLTSLYEGFSIAVLEAMAARLPVVATRVGGNPEAIVDGETGLLAPSFDAHALAEAVLSLLADESGRREIGQRARARVEREFTEEKMVARVAVLYEELLMERTR
jgi:glycosyltransferase involved in cell wall biosynthesis